MRTTIVAAVAVVLLAVALLNRPAAVAQPMPVGQKWEYKTIEAPVRADAWTPELIKAGREGWELAGTVSGVSGGDAMLIVKRPLL